MDKKILIFTASALGGLTALAGTSLLLIYKDFVKNSPKASSEAFKTFAKKKMKAKFKKPLKFSKEKVEKTKNMLEKVLDNIGEISFPNVLIRNI